MSAMMIFLGVAAASTVIVGLAAWAFLTWEHRREARRYAEHVTAKNRAGGNTARQHWRERGYR